MRSIGRVTTTWRAHLAVTLLALAVLTAGSLSRPGDAPVGLLLLALVAIVVAVAIAVKVLGDRSAPRLARIEATVVVGLVAAGMLVVFVGAPLLAS